MPVASAPRPQDRWRAAFRQDHGRERAPVLVAARQALLTGVGDGAGDRLIGPALAAGVVDVGTQRRTASRRAPRAALLAADVEEVRVDRDRRLAQRLPRLHCRIGFRGLHQAVAGTRARIAFTARLITLMAVHQQVWFKSLRGCLDDHQMAATAPVVPVAGGIEHRRRMAATEVVDQVRALGAGDGAGQEFAGFGACDRLARAGSQRQAQRAAGAAGRDTPEGGSEKWHGCPFGAHVLAMSTALTSGITQQRR